MGLHCRQMGEGAWEDAMLLLFQPREWSPESIAIIHISDSSINNLNLINLFFLGENRGDFVMKHSVPTLPDDLYTADRTQCRQASSLSFEAAGPAVKTH